LREQHCELVEIVDLEPAQGEPLSGHIG
jgi:hypothetical protein